MIWFNDKFQMSVLRCWGWILSCLRASMNTSLGPFGPENSARHLSIDRMVLIHQDLSIVPIVSVLGGGLLVNPLLSSQNRSNHPEWNRPGNSWNICTKSIYILWTCSFVRVSSFVHDFLDNRCMVDKLVSAMKDGEHRSFRRQGTRGEREFSIVFFPLTLSLCWVIFRTLILKYM